METVDSQNVMPAPAAARAAWTSARRRTSRPGRPVRGPGERQVLAEDGGAQGQLGHVPQDPLAEVDPFEVGQVGRHGPLLVGTPVHVVEQLPG